MCEFSENVQVSREIRETWHVCSHVIISGVV